MKINFKLRLGTLVILCITVVFLLATFMLFQTKQHVNKKQQTVQQIMENSFQLALLQGEYIAHPSERPRIQWINIHETQSRLLDEAMPLFLQAEEKKYLKIHVIRQNKVIFCLSNWYKVWKRAAMMWLGKNCITN